MSIAVKIREKRKAERMTTIQLGEILGVTASTITNWEKGTRCPDLKTLVKLTKIFGCSADELLGIERNGTEAQA